MSLDEMYRRHTTIWLNANHPEGATIGDPHGKTWVVVELAKVPATYWAKHGRAWTLPTGVMPWVLPSHEEYATRNPEDFAGSYGGAIRGDRDGRQQVLIPLKYMEELPPEWGEVCL